MRVKTKITLGLSFLFTVIVVLGAISIYYLNFITAQNQYLLREHYKSLEYSHNLQNALSEIRNSFEPDRNSRVSLNTQEYKIKAATASFEESLLKQKAISKEQGELQLVGIIEQEFNALKEYISVTRTKDYYFDKLLPILQGLSSKINQVYLLNQQAIDHRSELAEATAERVIYTVAGIVIFCILITFTFIIRFPAYIAKPVYQLNKAIDKLSAGNYSARVEIESDDEFGNLGTAFNTMAARMDEYERLNLNKLMTEKKRMETMIQKISEGIIGLDSEFNILFINPFAKRLLGIPRSKVKGKSAKNLSFENPVFQNIIQDIIKAENTGKRYTRNKLIKASLDEKTAYFIRKVIATYSKSKDNPELNGYILMLKNITEYKELDQARTNFIATISHELKTPIAAIKMSLKLLRDERLSNLTDEQAELVDSVDWEVNRLLNITQELLNANELETGKIQLHPENISPKEIVAEAIDSVITLAEDRKITFVEKADPALGKVFVDEDKVTWVLVNFLTNAVKYSPVGSTVEVEVKGDSEYVEFSVKDEGKGISNEHREKIFERYYRIPNSDGKGTGLGLSISKEIIQQMGGRIGVESEEKKGSRFYFQLYSAQATNV